MANPAFDVVNQFTAMQNEMRPEGIGLGPNSLPSVSVRPMGMTPSQGQARERPRPIVRPQPAAAPAGGGGGGDPYRLVDWGGRKVAASVLPYAQQIAQQFPGLRFSSGYRDPVQNARANGVRNSFHLKGRALDFSGSARDMQAARAWALQNGANEALIHNAGSGTHLHVAW